LLAEYSPGTFTQWVGDNVDHNAGTLDGRGTLHGMGSIAVSTPTDNVPLTAQSRVITRQQRVKVNELVRDKGVPILQYANPHGRGLASIFYKPIVELQVSFTLPSELYSNLLWHSGWRFNNTTRPRANWSGFMENATHHLTVFANLKCSFYSCMYSTLIYIQGQAEQLNIPTP